MLKFIWNSWWRNKERFILLLVGVLILSTGLSYLVGITQANNGTVVEELQKRWKSSYHIVVRPEGSRSVTEEMNLLEPNYLSGLEGGISLDQYEQIKAMADVEIAAPIAMIGSVKTNVQLEQLNITEPGIYRMNILEETNTGVAIEEFGGNTYFTIGKWAPVGLGQEYGASPEPAINLTYGSEVMIAGIDPIAESALVGIDQATMTDDYSRFFTKSDIPQASEDGDTQIPVIVSNADYVDAKMTYTIEKLDIPFSDAEQSETMEEIKEKGGQSFLETQEGSVVEDFVYTTDDVHSKMIEKILKPSKDPSVSVDDFAWMSFKPSPVEYKTVTSPFGERWPYSYQVQPYSVPDDVALAVRNMYRPVSMFGTSSDDWLRLRLNYIGVFDPGKLEISKDPLTELPMETYFPAKAQWVMDAENNPVNPHTDMKPLNNPYGFLTKPPLILTTIEAAAEVLGEEPISAIRVNVTAVDELNEETEAKLQAVAKEIEDQTGLITDVTLGSSPQLALTHLPGLEDEEALGWVQQPWIKIGSSISIFKETKIGMSGVIASVILVAIVYVFASSIIMLFARKKEFAVLLALGWRPSQLSKLLFLEATILGGLVALISWFILGVFFVSGSVDTSMFRVFLIGVSGLAIYWLGSLIPIALIRRINPFESMRSGEVSHRAKRIVRSESVIGMSFNNLFSQWQRSVLSVFAIAVPTSLFIFFLFVTFRLKGVLYATWLGEFVALEVGTMHYVAMGVALLIAILTTTEIMWQNVSERQAQIAVLKATGWHNNSVRFLVLWEGILTGLLAGIIGMAISLVIIYSMYGQLPTEELGFLSLTMLIPVATGMLGALLPAQKAARILPYQAINGTLHNSKKVEKQFKWALGTAGATLVVGIFSLFLFTLPEINNEPSGNVSETAVAGTEGELLADAPEKDEPEESGIAEDGAEIGAGEIAKLQEIAYHSYTLGDGTNDTEAFRLGDLVETPAGVQVTDKENRLISFPVTLDRSSDTESGSTNYKPQGFKMMDDTGTEYSVVNMEVVEGKENWRHNYKFISPNKMTAILTYELPKDLDRAVFVASGEFYSSPVVVEIPLEAASNATVIEDLKKNAYRTFDLGDENFEQTLELTLDQPVEPPTEVSPSNPNKQLISIPITLEMDGEGGWFTYKPHGFRLVDQSGNEYSSTHMEVTEKGNWKGKYKFITPSKTSVILTYELPKDVEQIVFTATNAILPGMLVVDIPLPGQDSHNSNLSPGASAAYNIDLALDEQDVFQISTEIEVTNESQDSWKNIGFYFIPNALTDANKPEFMEEGAETAISSITSNGTEIPFELDGNRLLLELDQELKPGEMKQVKIDYTLQLPENGNRLSQVDDNFYLAQWYPMLGHYNNGWNIRDYDSKGESYHTSYGSYEIDFQLPAEYLVASSAQDGEILPMASGALKGANIKDFYLAFLNPEAWHAATSSVNNTALRIYIPSSGQDFTADMMAVTEDAFGFFEEKIADHPAKELDVIANDGGMEYPNIIEVTSNPDDYEHTLIHEIAHQWFYYLVANDPYTDAWLDESIAEWVAAMYMVEEGYPAPFEFAENIATAGANTHFINLALDEFEEGEYYATVYGKTPLLLQEYFEANGGSDAAFGFLAEYVERFRLDYVDTAKFAEFFVEQNSEDSQAFLDSWLDLEKE